MGACGSEGPATPVVAATGPPSVELDQVERHARQFDEDLPERPAGSQDEQAASVYLLGHLQQAGYLVLLDAVPVGNLVRSTNVVAAPPSGGDPALVVAVPYDTAEGYPSNGIALGVFLEAARAMRVSLPDHSVQFVALGAERVTGEPGNLGSRRLAQELIDNDVDPTIVLIDRAGPDVSFSARGPIAPEFLAAAESAGVPGTGTPPKPDRGDEVWSRAGARFVYVSGRAEEVATALMQFLTDQAR
jgi:hypothetical protein